MIRNNKLLLSIKLCFSLRLRKLPRKLKNDLWKVPYIRRTSILLKQIFLTPKFLRDLF